MRLLRGEHPARANLWSDVESPVSVRTNPPLVSCMLIDTGRPCIAGDCALVSSTDPPLALGHLVRPPEETWISSKTFWVFGILKSNHGIPPPNHSSFAMVDTPNFPPTDGSILVLPGFADFHAVHNPDLPWARFPSREDPTKSEAITFAQFANATHRIAHTFRPHRQGDHDGEVVGVIINCDSILYCATIVGLVRAGFVVCHILRSNQCTWANSP